LVSYLNVIINYKLGLATSKTSTQTMKVGNDFNWNTAADKHKNTYCSRV